MASLPLLLRWRLGNRGRSMASGIPGAGLEGKLGVPWPWGSSGAFRVPGDVTSQWSSPATWQLPLSYVWISMWRQYRGWGSQMQGPSTWNCAWASYRTFWEVTASRGSKQEERQSPPSWVSGVTDFSISHPILPDVLSSLRPSSIAFIFLLFPRPYTGGLPPGSASHPCRVE